VGRGGALGALDRGWEVAAAASTASRSCGGGPARCGARERKCQWKCRCVKARGSAWEALGCARGSDEGVVMQEQELASRRESWRLGRRWRDVERRGESQRGVGSGGAGAGAARGARKGGTGAAGARHMAGEGGGVGQRRKQRRRTRGRRRGT
jgi:hypothetical protein